MILTSEAYIKAQESNARDVFLGFFQSRMGRRCYSFQTPTAEQMGSAGGIATYNGDTYVGDGSLYGSQAIILDWGALMVSFGSLRETLSPENTNLLSSLTGEEISGMTITLNNNTQHFSEVLWKESFFFQTFLLRHGYVGLTYRDFISLYTGVITQETLTDTELVVVTQAT